MKSLPINARLTGAARLAPLLALLLGPPALAQYKVVAPDGSVTYTDRPSPDAAARVTPLSRRAATGSPEATLPPELRQVQQRYPVTLYAAADCPPCDAGRKLLQQRGIPYSERRIASEDDAQALERLVGARSVPALTIGAQPLRGYAEADWTNYLDVAGYPRESKLPRNWPIPEATALVERSAPAPRPAAPPPPAAPAAPENTTTPPGLRF